MDFRYKCFLQQIFSRLPKSEEVNYLFQRHISRTLPFSDTKFLIKVNTAFLHYENFRKFSCPRELNGRYYEFGAGWNLIVPLFFSYLPLEVFVVDIKKLSKKQLVNESIQKFNSLRASIPIPVRTMPEIKDFSDLEEKFGLHYFAPIDARKTQFPDNYFDVSSSTVTLEHIPPNDILKLLQETYRIMKQGGIVSITINYRDHWSHFDNSISIYNFLKYSSREWKKYNPSLQYQNRLRHSDYMNLIAQTRFKVVKEEPHLPDEKEKEELLRLKLSEEYLNYDLDDLGIKGSEIVLKK